MEIQNKSKDNLRGRGLLISYIPHASINVSTHMQTGYIRSSKVVLGDGLLFVIGDKFRNHANGNGLSLS